MAEIDQRVVRIPVPVRLIREMDAVVIEGIGGYATRAEFIVDAIQERILELTIASSEEVGATPVPDEITETKYADAGGELAATTPSIEGDAMSVSTTMLECPEDGFVIDVRADRSRPESMPLFGLHNRDYPSLWALTRLAEMTSEQPIPIEDYYSGVLTQAWSFGELLLAAERRTGRKCTAIFPTNPDKRKAAEMGFRMFAVGDYRVAADDAITTGGPLFEWRVAGLTGSGKEPFIGITAAGWRLLGRLGALSVEEPHSRTAAAAFLEHLAEDAPADRAAFAQILQAVGVDGATRQEVLRHVARAWPEWTKNEVSTNAGGYIARAREWGLMQPKQTKSRYHLAAFGLEQLDLSNDGVQS